MTFKNATEVVQACENLLGLEIGYNERNPIYRARATQAGLLKKKMAEKPELYTFANLEATVAYLQGKRQPLNSAAGLCFFVDEAIGKLAEVEPARTSLEDAMSWERDNPRPESAKWLRRLARTEQCYAREVLCEWEESKTNG